MVEQFIEFIEEIIDIKENGLRIKHLFTIPINFILALPFIIIMLIFYLIETIGETKIK